MENDIYQTLSNMGATSLEQRIVAEIHAPHSGVTPFVGSVGEFVNLVTPMLDSFGTSCYTIFEIN